jgi:hypothetical protein
MLPEQFVASASARGWQVPPVDRVEARVPGVLLYNAVRSGDVERLKQIDARTRDALCEPDYSVWLEWAKGLPDVPDEQPDRDPTVLERFSLVIQCDETGAPDEQVEAFFEGVWDKVAEQYGRHVAGVGWGDSIEWISVKHREAVVALVLDGLRRYGLMDDRITVIRCEHDPDDWQRDRALTVWPQGFAADPAAATDRGLHSGSGEDKVTEGSPGD